MSFSQATLLEHPLTRSLALEAHGGRVCFVYRPRHGEKLACKGLATCQRERFYPQYTALRGEGRKSQTALSNGKRAHTELEDHINLGVALKSKDTDLVMERIKARGWTPIAAEVPIASLSRPRLMALRQMQHTSQDRKLMDLMLTMAPKRMWTPLTHSSITATAIDMLCLDPKTNTLIIVELKTTTIEWERYQTLYHKPCKKQPELKTRKKIPNTAASHHQLQLAAMVQMLRNYNLGRRVTGVIMLVCDNIPRILPLQKWALEQSSHRSAPRSRTHTAARYAARRRATRKCHGV